MRHKFIPLSGLTTLVFLILLLFLGLFTQQSFPQTNEDIIEQFFPQKLIDESRVEFEQGGLEPFKASDFAIADLDRTGRAEYIVAAYTNGFSAAVRVLRKQAGIYILVDEPDLPLLGGTFPKVQVFDLDGDGKPELIISFMLGRGSMVDWVLKWNNTHLNLISPPPTDKDGNLSFPLINSVFIDLDRDGKVETISTHQIDGGIVYDVYHLDGAHYSLLNSLVFFETFIRQTGAPQVESRSLSILNAPGRFLLKIINGDDKGKNRVSSAVISINGVVVAGPERFNQQVAEITAPVTLQSTNTLNVELRSAPGSQLTVTIEP